MAKQKYLPPVPANEVPFDYDNFRPIECSKYPGYYHVPGIPSIGIAKDSTIIKLENGCIVHYPRPDENLKNNRYLKVNIPPFKLKNGKIFIPFSRLVHHLVLLAFYGLPPKHIPKPIANHLDGNKWNNHYLNLEWTDYHGNNSHAVKTGLRNDNHPVLGKNLRTGEIKEWISFGECAREFGVKSERPFDWVKHPERIRKGEWLFKRKSDPRPWPDVVFEPDFLSLHPDYREIQGVNPSKGICVFGRNASETARLAGIPVSKLTGSLKKNVMIHMTNDGWFFKDKKFDGPIPENELMYKWMKGSESLRPIQAYDPKTKICYFSPSVADLVRYLSETVLEDPIGVRYIRDTLRKENFSKCRGLYFRYPESERSFLSVEEDRNEPWYQGTDI